MFDAGLIHQVLYRLPKTPFEAAITYMVSQEIYQRAFISRSFHWHENTIHARQLPENSFVFSSLQDNLVDGESVLRYLASQGFSSEKTASAMVDHAEFLLDSKAFKEVLSGFNRVFEVSNK